MEEVLQQAFIVMDKNDDVATALKKLECGEKVQVKDGAEPIQLQSDIPFGHKFALREIIKGAPVRKYGQVIGRASIAIRIGDHVHVHNLESMRGRGDLVKAGEGNA